MNRLAVGINDDIYVMKMTKKATRRIIRKRIAQRKAKDATKHNTKPNNSIRSQMMNNAALNMATGIRRNIVPMGIARPFGFAPQQYGNVNNERRIEQLRNDAHLKSSELQNTNAIIENMQKEIKDLSADLASAKKQKKKIKAEHDKAEHEKDMAEDVFNENRRMEMDNERLLEKKRSLERQNAIVNKDIHIGELKKQKIDIEANLHKAELEAIEKQKQIESNAIYNDINKIKNEIDTVIAQNAAYDKILESDEFQKPNAEYIEKTKQLHLAKEENRRKQELYKLELENKQQQEELAASITLDELNAITQQFAAKTNEIRANTLSLNWQKMQQQDAIDIFEHHHKQYMDSAKEEIEERYKLNSLTNQVAYMNNQLKKTNANKHYNAQITRTANLRIKNTRQALKLKNKEEELAMKKENDVLEKMNELNPKDLTQDEMNLVESIGIEKARNVALKRKQRLKEDLHESSLKKSEEIANNDFHNTPEYQNMLKNDIELKVETQKNLNEADALKRTAASAKQLEQSKVSFEVSKRFKDTCANDVEQVNYHLDEANKTFKNMTEKNQIVSALQSKIQTFGQGWIAFLNASGSDKILGILNDENTNAEVLQDIYNSFERFLRTPPPSSTLQITYQNNNDGEADFDPDFQ